MNKSWNIIEFLSLLSAAIFVSIFFHKFSSGTWFGVNGYSGVCILVLLSACVTGYFTKLTLNAFIRGLTPALFIYLFHSAAMEGGLVENLQARVGFPHFALVLVSTLLAIYFTPDVEKIEPVIKEKQEVTEVKEIDYFGRIIGQEHVTDSLREIARITKAGIRVGKRNAPHAVLLFLGPTGVGKTEAATALAEAVYGTKDSLIRFDMGQFNDASQANRFYGPPPGYVGSEEGGQLTRAVYKKPKSVVLLDEMEKAHPQIWDAFLPVFDEGYIVDGSTNQKVDMTDTIIVLTSNLLAGTENLKELSAFELKERVEKTGILRPELLGRINEILVFYPLSHEAIAEILRRRLDASLWSLSDQGISISVDDETVNRLVEEVKKAKFGVRQIDDVVRTFLRKRISLHSEKERQDKLGHS